MKLDGLDRRILNLIQEASSTPAEKLAETVPLSASAIQRRLRRLREAGVIQRDIAVLDPRSCGQPAFFVVALEVERERPECLLQLRQWLALERQVQQAFYVTGEADFILIVTAPDNAGYDELMTRMMLENPNIRRFRTNVALSLVKRGLTLPLRETDTE